MRTNDRTKPLSPCLPPHPLYLSLSPPPSHICALNATNDVIMIYHVRETLCFAVKERNQYQGGVAAMRGPWYLPWTDQVRVRPRWGTGSGAGVGGVLRNADSTYSLTVIHASASAFSRSGT